GPEPEARAGECRIPCRRQAHLLGRMRILFLTWRPALRRFVDLVVHLERSGHDVRIAYPATRTQGFPPGLKHSSVQLLAYDEVSSDTYGTAIGVLRRSRDYLWYLSPQHS